MRLEDAIKQKKFESEHQKLALNIIYTSSWLSNATEKTFKQYDISSQQYNLLRILKGSHPQRCSVRTLLERMLDKSSNITRLVDKLMDKNLVTRSENPESRREQLIAITKGGMALLAKMDNDVRQSFSIMKRLSEEEAKLSNDMLDKLKG